MIDHLVHIASPALFSGSAKKNVIDGEVWALRDHISAAGYRTNLCDGYFTKTESLVSFGDKTSSHCQSVLVIHLWKADIYGTELVRILNLLQQFKLKHPFVSVIAFGYVANAAVDDLNSKAVTVDIVATARGVRYLSARPRDPLSDSVANLITEHLRTPSNNNEGALVSFLERNPAFNAETVVSLHASRGCRARCSFCAYNSDLAPGWIPRQMTSVASEIEAVLKSTPTRRIAFFDNDFGGDARSLTARAGELHALLALKGLLNQASIAINVRSDCLTPENIAILGEIGVRTILVGLESFNPHTRHRLFHKRVDEAQLAEVVRVCDQVGIQVLLSYILWHPWQTIQGVGAEINEIKRWGRYRVPQFLSRSVLKVVPGTPIETMLSKDGLLSVGYLDREFKFTDPGAEKLFRQLKTWLDTALAESNRSIGALAELKLAELEKYEEALQHLC